MEAQRGSTSEREELEERPGERTSRKASKAGELLGEGGGQAGGWTGEVWRDSGPRQLSALGRKEGGEYVSGFLPEGQVPQAGGRQDPGYSPDLGEGAERSSPALYSQHTCQQSFLAANFSTLAVTACPSTTYTPP